MLLHESDCRPTRVFVPTGWHHYRHSAGCAGAHCTDTGLHSIPTVCTKEERIQVQRPGQFSSSQVSTDIRTVLDIVAVSSISHTGLQMLL